MERARTCRRGAALLAAILLLTGWLLAAAGGAESAPEIVRRGIDAYARGQPARAYALFAQAAAEDQRSALAALWAGVAAVAAGRYRDAQAWLGASLARPHTEQEGRIAAAWLARVAALNQPVRVSGSTWLRIAGLAKASNPRLTDGQARWIGQAVVAAARREGIDPWLLASVIYIESRFNHQSVSWAGAMGLGQLMPETAAAAGVDPRDPWGNILGAAEVLRWNYLEFRSWPLALAAYNAGAEAVRRWGGVPPYAETQWYVRAVLYVYAQLARLGSS
jgi:soluble lytic murein transglycosylase-like protein